MRIHIDGSPSATSLAERVVQNKHKNMSFFSQLFKFAYGSIVSVAESLTGDYK